MPGKALLTNKAVLKAAADTVGWRLKISKEFAENVPKGAYDIRHIADIAGLLFDAESSKETRDAYLLGELQKMAKAFSTVDERTGKTDLSCIKPYVKRLYERVVYTSDIDWNDQKSVEDLLATMQASQALATLARDFPELIFELFPTHEEMARMEAISAKTALLFKEIRTAIGRDPEAEEAMHGMKIATDKRGSAIKNDMSVNVSSAIFDARLEGNRVVTIDPLQSELMKKLFMNEPFSIEENDDDTIDNREFALTFMQEIGMSSMLTTMEQIPHGIIANALDVDWKDYRNVFINGKPLSEIVSERNQKVNSGYKTQRDVAEEFCKALTDGKSVVTLMHMTVSGDGKTQFAHQEIKVDLDALNASQRNGKQYSAFRRFLDWLKIWKIDKFPDNKTRDAKQKKLMSSEKFKTALRAAEERIVNDYNSSNVQKSSSNFIKAMPKMIRVEKVEKTEAKQEEIQTNVQVRLSEENLPLREHLPGVSLDPPTTNLSTEPKKEYVPTPSAREAEK